MASAIATARWNHQPARLSSLFRPGSCSIVCGFIELRTQQQQVECNRLKDRGDSVNMGIVGNLNHARRSRSAVVARQWQAALACRLVTAAVTTTSQSYIDEFPAFVPSEIQFVKDADARKMAVRLQQLPVQTSLSREPILTSCVTPLSEDTSKPPLLFIHGFDSSLLEWRRLFPLLEAGGVAAWAVDILGWGFSTSDGVSSFAATAKREHLFEFWKTHIKKPVILVGASLGGSIAIDFAVAHPTAVLKLILIDAQGFAKGLGNLSTFPKFLAYAGIALLKSRPLRCYANYLAFSKINTNDLLDCMRVGRLHTFVPGWSDASVNFMLSGGYSVGASIPEVQQETLVIWGRQDKILPKDYAERFQKELPRARLLYVEDAGHIPHVESPETVKQMILSFI